MKNRVRPRCLNLVSFPVIFATVHTIVYYLELVQLKSEKSEDLEYLAVINYEILEYMFWNKANCYIKFSPNG